MKKRFLLLAAVLIICVAALAMPASAAEHADHSGWTELTADKLSELNHNLSTGSYYLDADLTNFIKEKYPSVKCAVATCWEEGPKAYHTCNNSCPHSDTSAYAHTDAGRHAVRAHADSRLSVSGQNGASQR